MAEKKLTKLKIDPVFKNLIRPLRPEEYRQLEENIVKEGCRDAIIVWGETIIDGHNRYEICFRHSIPFETKPIVFLSKDEAIVWICSNQLGRRNITDETRRYLIGKRYETEKNLGSKNTVGRNQYTYEEGYYDEEDEEELPPSAGRTASRIADEYHISHGTVEKYAIYSRALDEVQRKEPALVPGILSGKIKLSHENLVDLSKLPASEISKFRRKVDNGDTSYMNFYKTRRALPSRQRGHVEEEPLPEIKNMPVYNADSEVEGIILTIPSWTSSIVRTQGKADFAQISQKSKDKLKDALIELSSTINGFLESMSNEEANND